MSKQMCVPNQVHATLVALSKATGKPMNTILKEWTGALQEILDEISFSNLSVVSYRAVRNGVGHPVVITGIMPTIFEVNRKLERVEIFPYQKPEAKKDE